MNERDLTRAKILGVLVRDARLHAGRSLEECAAALGVEPGRLEQIETGDAGPSLPELEALAVYLGVPLAHFWGTRTLGDYPPTRLEGLVAERRRDLGAAVQAAREEDRRPLQDLAAAVGLDPDRLARVEAGEEDVTLLELEQIATALGRSLNAFSGEDHELISRHEARQKRQRRFEELPEEMKAFVIEPVNRSYLEIAMRLSRMDVNELRAVAENILNITF